MKTSPVGASTSGGAGAGADAGADAGTSPAAAADSIAGVSWRCRPLEEAAMVRKNLAGIDSSGAGAGAAPVGLGDAADGVADPEERLGDDEDAEKELAGEVAEDGGDRGVAEAEALTAFAAAAASRFSRRCLLPMISTVRRQRALHRPFAA